MRQPETTREWRDYYEKLYQKNYSEYQQCGEPRYDRAQYKYSVIVDAFDAKLELESEREIDIKKRKTNCDAVIDRLAKSEYSREEVKKYLQDAIWW